jgi:hypothetical protein
MTKISDNEIFYQIEGIYEGQDYILMERDHRGIINHVMFSCGTRFKIDMLNIYDEVLDNYLLLKDNS